MDYYVSENMSKYYALIKLMFFVLYRLNVDAHIRSVLIICQHSDVQQKDTEKVEGLAYLYKTFVLLVKV